MKAIMLHCRSGGTWRISQPRPSFLIIHDSHKSPNCIKVKELFKGSQREKKEKHWSFSFSLLSWLSHTKDPQTHTHTTFKADYLPYSSILHQTGQNHIILLSLTPMQEVFYYLRNSNNVVNRHHLIEGLASTCTGQTHTIIKIRYLLGLTDLACQLSGF